MTTYEPDSREAWDHFGRVMNWIIGVTIAVLIGCCIACCVWYKSYKEGGSSGLATHQSARAPRAVRSRLEAAFRDAQDGYNQCQACGFENFRRFPSCCLCGALVHTRNGTKQTHTAAESGYSELRDAAPGLNVGASTLANLSERQRRVRKRKEWMRKVDVSGNLYWYRDGDVGIDSHFPGYTLEYAVDTQTAGLAQQSLVVKNLSSAHASPSPVSDAQIIVDVETPALQSLSRGPRRDSTQQVDLLSMESVVQMLNNETQTLVSPVLTEATLANPERMPVQLVDERPSPIILWLDVLQLASQDFPTKYAHFVAKTSQLIQTSQIVSAHVIRLSLLDDSMQFLSLTPRANIRSPLRVSFYGETGIDAGGLKREWYELLTQQLCEPANGILKCVDMSEQTYYLNTNSAKDIGDDHLLYYFATGRFVGRALLEGQVLNFHLALPLLKIVLGMPVSFSDLAYFSPQVYTSMVWMKENTGVDALGLDFSVTERRGDNEVVVVDLVENGRNIPVTDENKDLYLERSFRYVLFESVSSQLFAFLKGLYEVIPQDLLMLFDPEELDFVLCGSDTIDLDDWQSHTKISGALCPTVGSSYKRQAEVAQVTKWFWEVVREMPDEYRRRLLHFATGSFRVPIAGFSALTSYDSQLSPFTLHGVKLSESEYISSRACFNHLTLPMYTTKEKLELVVYATLDTELYGFTTA
ncbi:Nedd4 e3 ubiquitin-protein ligase wwp1 [Globisporangium polare]